MTRVLIAVDDSYESNDAACFAHSVFGDRVDYIVLTVAETSATMVGAVPLADPTLGGAYLPPEIARETLEASKREAEEAAARAAELVHASAVTIVEFGEPGDAICRAAEEHRVDLIVIGSHDRNWFSRLVTPSVRNHLVEHAPCPVLVVR
jgi:nucleotide-binding universal stress UspA family protein